MFDEERNERVRCVSILVLPYLFRMSIRTIIITISILSILSVVLYPPRLGNQGHRIELIGQGPPGRIQLHWDS